MSIERELRRALDEDRLTQREVAAWLKISEKHLSEILNGKAGASHALLEAIADFSDREWYLLRSNIIDQIRDAYTEAVKDYNNPDDTRRMFLFGMRYVMNFLGMPEGKSNLDKA